MPGITHSHASRSGPVGCAWPDQRISGALPGRERAFNQGQMNHRNRGASGSVNRLASLAGFEPSTCRDQRKWPVSWVFPVSRAYLLLSRRVS
jgi:hypothetical protein